MSPKKCKLLEDTLTTGVVTGYEATVGTYKSPPSQIQLRAK
jgi:hypothetical protein